MSTILKRIDDQPPSYDDVALEPVPTSTTVTNLTHDLQPSPNNINPELSDEAGNPAMQIRQNQNNNGGTNCVIVVHDRTTTVS